MNAQIFRQKEKQFDYNQLNYIKLEEGEDQQLINQRKQDLKYELAAKKLRAKTRIQEKYKKYSNLKEIQQQELSLTQSLLQLQNKANDRDSRLNESQNQKKLESKPCLILRGQSNVYQQKEQDQSQLQEQKSDLNLQFWGYKDQQQKGNQNKLKDLQTLNKIKSLSSGNYQIDLNQTLAKAFEEQIKIKDFRTCKNQSKHSNLIQIDSFIEENSLQNFKLLSKSFDKQSFSNDFQISKKETKKELKGPNQKLNLSNEEYKQDQINEKLNYPINQKKISPGK